MAKRSNEEADIEREKAYRRGYAYGIRSGEKQASGRHWIAGCRSSPKPGQSIATVVKFDASRS